VSRKVERLVIAQIVTEKCEQTPIAAKLCITSLNPHSAGIYTGTRYASINVEKKKSPH